MNRATSQSWIISLAFGLSLILGAAPAADGQVYQEDTGQTVYPQKDGGVVVYNPTGGGTVTACPGGSDTCNEVDCSTNREDCADILQDALDGLDEEQAMSAPGATVPVDRALLGKLSQQSSAFSGGKVFVIAADEKLRPVQNARDRHRRDISRVSGR